ncbi:nitroreductase family deazaflavin-dependent oxidoreductase [Micromonospora sp. WMMA1363]|uniref:nitroreductase family deazaflavin-dependent oxidoreductase n=1 Tax=Micromonospora sp. WMMA1363 TaxID=3053985 RepID=UPI00259C8C0A|nr:nitroreductase family deazaflavin-dependent oxidoreductase [Micromonospora sp. WMMA1363]MDM4719327.1 nitroreductase family deazaflavin-dependent oxidoreductase [Micromonospora sp. WMMA1363]
MESIGKPKAPTGMRRLMFRLPVYLYRVGLGARLGGRFLYLVHTGRVSGRRRDVVIEVVGRDGDSYLVCSGFGVRAQWYRNVLANPGVTIQVGRRRTRAVAVPLRPGEGEFAMARYGERNPVLARKLCAVLGFAVDGSADDFREVGRRLPFLRLVPNPS